MSSELLTQSVVAGAPKLMLIVSAGSRRLATAVSIPSRYAELPLPSRRSTPLSDARVRRVTRGDDPAGVRTVVGNGLRRDRCRLSRPQRQDGSGRRPRSRSRHLREPCPSARRRRSTPPPTSSARRPRSCRCPRATVVAVRLPRPGRTGAAPSIVPGVRLRLATTAPGTSSTSRTVPPRRRTAAAIRARCRRWLRASSRRTLRSQLRRRLRSGAQRGAASHDRDDPRPARAGTRPRGAASGEPAEPSRP